MARGVALSTEMMLLLLAIVLLTLAVAAAFLGMSMSQAASDKATAKVTEATVRLFYRGSTCEFTSVTFKIANFGDRKIRVTRVEILQPNGNVFPSGGIYVDRQVNPGEVLPISVSERRCPDLRVPGTAAEAGSVFLQVTYMTEDGSRRFWAGAQAKVEVYRG